MFSSNATQVSSAANYIEDVFSTYLYTGNGSTQTITNGIDLSGKGGLAWIKGRSLLSNNRLVDTTRGAGNALSSDTTGASSSQTTGLTAFASNGFSLGSSAGYNNSADTYASWTFRKQPKFFDVVTFTTGASNTNQRISHSLGSVPGMIIVKRTDGVDNWFVWHRSLSSTTDNYLYLNSTIAEDTTGGAWGTTGPTSTDFGIDDNFFGGGRACVAYIFAHNAGGFGLTGTDNVISCGSYTGNLSTSGPVVTLGYEPQLLLIKNSTNASDWFMLDTMRGLPVSGSQAVLAPNNSDAEYQNAYTGVALTATGFKLTLADTTLNESGSTYIYIAIRRGPMKVPTDATKVFGLSARSGTGANATVTGGQIDDAVLVKKRASAVASLFSSRLTGTGYLVTSSTSAEVAAGTTILQANPWDVMDGVKVGTTSTITNASANTYINYLFKRAPSFFDEVCYSGTGSAMTVSHNLQAVPEMIIVKNRSNLTAWAVYSPIGPTKILTLNTTDAETTFSGSWNNTAPTSSVFTVGNSTGTNQSGNSMVAYLFATCAGVSKVGSYTGNGSTQTIDCGFTGGARFVLIKRTDSTGNWYVYDTARGMTTLTDPYLLLNSTAAESATLGSVTTVSTGFAINASILAAINTNGASYIFLAIA